MPELDLSKQDTPNKPTEGLGTAESAAKGIPCTILCAASSDSEYTGAARMCKFQHESNNNWRHQPSINIHGNWPEAMILGALIAGIWILERELEGTLLAITIETNADTIVRGFNEHRTTWEACNFINSKGNKMNHTGLWKQLFRIADKHQTTIRKPQEYANEYKACKRLAKQACVMARAHGENEEMRKSLEGTGACAPNMEYLGKLQDRAKSFLNAAGRDVYKDNRQACIKALEACHSQMQPTNRKQLD